jgi:Fe-S cluster assembly ATP-binding protein
MFKVEGLSVAVGGSPLLSDISFSLSRGEILYVLGPNGAGKTSLLKAIMSIPGYEVIRGRILLEGEDVTNLKPFEKAQKGLALAFQTPPRLHGVRVEALLTYICKHTGCDVHEVAKTVGIEHLLDREVGRLSGGESKRVELATVLAQRPKVALIDEPDSGVDVESLSVVAQGLKQLASEAALVIVTHGAHIARYLSPHKACILYGGTFKNVEVLK